MRRGFPTDARAIATEVRQELGLTPLDRLDPWKLAKHLDVPVLKLSEFYDLAPECVQVLQGPEQSAFSAMIACIGLRQVVIYNDCHAPTRQRADICHELAHALLLHAPHRPEPGRPPKFDAAQEEEAALLGSVLLVTDEACLQAVRQRLSVADAAQAMGVSQDLMRWRINKSGARKRVARAQGRAA